MERGGSRSDAMADASPIQGERLGAYGTSAAGSQQRQAGENGEGRHRSSDADGRRHPANKHESESLTLGDVLESLVGSHDCFS